VVGEGDGFDVVGRDPGVDPGVVAEPAVEAMGRAG